MRFWAAAALAAWAGIAAAQDPEAEAWLLSYEAVPSAQVELNLDVATYDQRAAVAQASAETISPRALAAAGLDPAAVETMLTPGGYLLETSPSLQALGPMSEAEAVRAAAALGYVYRQWSVLVSRLDEARGDTGYVSVAFPDGGLTPEAAQAFFEAAAALDEGLGGGYTAFDDLMIFLNVRDEDHNPYSGLDDIAFAAKLGQAAGAFEGAALRVDGAGYARALFVGNDWETAPQGEDYARILGDPAMVEALDALRAEHDGLVETLGAQFGWR